MPIYDYACFRCATELHDQYRTFEDFDDPHRHPRCPTCRKRMSVVIGAVSVGKVSGGYPMKVCETCRKRTRVSAPYEMGGCSNGTRCRGYSPFDVAEARKKEPYGERLRREGKTRK